MNDLLNKPIIVFDGACGTSIQLMDLPKSVWGVYDGCNEYLNISSPETIIKIHRQFLEAGADVIETNTFGASAIVLGEYALEDKVVEINTAAVKNAKAAIVDFPHACIAGSIGPTTKLPTLGQIPIDTLADTYRIQIRTLVENGVDLLIIETVQDLLQLKTAVIVAQEVFAETGITLPIMASITVEKTGTMLIGTEVAAVAATLEPFGLFSIGLNCATGPDLMGSHLHVLSDATRSRISCLPNAGMPETHGDKMVYPLSPELFASSIAAFVKDVGVSIVGGCCGTTSEHIRHLAAAVKQLTPKSRQPEVKPAISSTYQAIEIKQDIPPLLVGERTNVNGSKKFRELILANDYDGALGVGLQQQENGAHAADLCTAYAGRDEKKDLTIMVSHFAQSIKVPLVIDSTIPEFIEAGLKHYPGRAVINSINLEDGGVNLDKICRMAKKYGAAVIALTISETGMAMTTEEKLTVAKRIYERAVGTHGLEASDLFFDVLTFTIGSGDATLVNAAVESLNAIKRVKEELPGVSTILGVSNISFGLSARSRKFLNSVFLHEAVEAGLDAAIIDPAKIIPLAQLDADDREICLDLVYNRQGNDGTSPLELFINHFDSDDKKGTDETKGNEETVPEVALTNKVIKGDKGGIEDILAILQSRMTPVSIINTLLIPAMRKVGEMFGRGDMLLPFVLKSAETMKACVTYLEPFMESKEDEAGTTVLLATVQGDVHDIGKNLVDIILSNNGYKVINIGIKVPAEVIIEKAKEFKVDVIGLSGLLVKSALVMRDNMALFKDAGLTIPILLGGAALTRAFVAESCVPAYDAPVVYCTDAFAGLHALQQHENGSLQATVVESTDTKPAMKPGRKDITIDHTTTVPVPPFTGSKQVTDIDLEKLFSYINEQALFRGRWGYRRGALSAEEYGQLIDTTVKPLYASLKRKLIDDGLARPAVTYGYYKCNAVGDGLEIYDGSRTHTLSFPRQSNPPHLCIADFFRSADEGEDYVGFFVVTIGEAVSEATKKLYESNEYHDYLMLHALSVELTDALAEYWHEKMRDELGISAQKPSDMLGYAVQEYQGSRYGFGYPACPDLDAHKVVFELLKPELIGVTLTENMEMVPEQTTSALIAHHPQAKYFAV